MGSICYCMLICFESVFQDSLGIYETSLGSLVAMRTTTKPLHKYGSDGKDYGSITS